MITYFSKNIQSNKDKNELIKSLNNLLLKGKNDYFAIFPLCLFDSKYYTFLRQKRKSPYKGKIDKSEFHFERQIAYGGTTNRRIRTVNIDGKIIDQQEKRQIQLKFKTYPISLIVFIILIPFSFWLYLKMDNVVWLLIIPIILINEILIIIKDTRRIKKETTSA